MIKNGFEYEPLSSCLKRFPNSKQFANIVTGYNTRVNFFEPVRKIGNNILISKGLQLPKEQ